MKKDEKSSGMKKYEIERDGKAGAKNSFQIIKKENVIERERER